MAWLTENQVILNCTIYVHSVHCTEFHNNNLGYSLQNRCSMWLKYGFLANEEAVIIVNSVGTTLFLAYSIVFWQYANNIRTIYRQFFIALLVLCLTFTYTEWYEVNRAETIEVVGKSRRFRHLYTHILFI